MSETLSRLSSVKTDVSSCYYLTYKFLFKNLKSAIESNAKGDILDIGCGNKPYMSFFTKYVKSYIGCDIAQSDKNLVDIICKATDIPLQDESKDTVFSTQVIEHVADHKKMLAEAFRILKPGGTLIISGPMHWEHHEIPYDFFRFTKYGFQYILSESGFKQIEINPCGGKWALSGQVLLNSIRSSFEKRSFKRKLAKGIYIVFGLKWIINFFFGWLEKMDTDYSATLNFVVVARKPTL